VGARVEIPAQEQRLAELRERLAWEQGTAEAERQRDEEARQEVVKGLVEARVAAVAKVAAAITALVVVADIDLLHPCLNLGAQRRGLSVRTVDDGQLQPRRDPAPAQRRGHAKQQLRPRQGIDAQHLLQARRGAPD